MKRILLTLLTITLLGVAVRAQQTWSQPVKVTSIQVSTLVSLTFATPPFTHTCTNKSGWWVLGGDAANIQNMTTVAATAMTNARNVVVLYGGCTAQGYPTLTGIRLLPG